MCAMKIPRPFNRKSNLARLSGDTRSEDIKRLLLVRARLGILLLWCVLVLTIVIYVSVQAEPVNYGMMVLLLVAFLLVELGTNFFPFGEYRPYLFFIMMCAVLALISSLVYFTGNRESLLGFLFLAVPIYAAAYYSYAGTLLVSGITAVALFIPFFSGNIEPVQILSLTLSAVSYFILGLIACYIVEHEEPYARESHEFGRLLEVSRTREKEISVVYDLSRKFSYTLDLETVLNTTTALARRMLGSKGSIVFLVEEGRPTLKAGLGIRPSADMGTVEIPSGEEWMKRLSHGNNVVEENLQLPWLPLPQEEQNDYYDIAAAPLFFGREVAGYMICFTPTDRPFPKDHVEILSTLASQAAVAVEKAHLYTRTLADKTKLETIFSALRDGLLVTDSSGILIQANAVAENIFKVGSSIIGQRLSTLLKSAVATAEFGDYDLEEALEAALGGHDISGEMTFAGEDGITAQAHFIPLKDEPVGVSGVVLFLHDITELKRLDAMKSNFVSNVSHELRTPLTSISGYVDLLIAGRAGTLTAKQEKYLSVVKEQATNLTKMIEDLLDLSRLKSAGERTRLEKTNIAKAIDESIKRLEDQARKKDIKVEARVSTNVPAAAANHARVTQIIANILENAIKFTPPGGLVEISALKNEPYVQVQVTDNGIGIPPAALPLVFNRFFQAQPGNAAESGGFGLGLAISREIVDLYGGSISAESEPGKGSTFFFTVPIYSADIAGD